MICADPLLLFSGCRSQDKIVFMSLINSEKGNKSSKKIPLRAPVTERMSRAQSSLELFYSSLFKLFNKYTNSKFTYCQECGRGVEEDSATEKAQGAATQDINNVWGNQHLVSQQLQQSDGLPVSSAVLCRVQER